MLVFDFIRVLRRFWWSSNFKLHDRVLLLTLKIVLSSFSNDEVDDEAWTRVSLVSLVNCSLVTYCTEAWRRISHDAEVTYEDTTERLILHLSFHIFDCSRYYCVAFCFLDYDRSCAFKQKYEFICVNAAIDIILTVTQLSGSLKKIANHVLDRSMRSEMACEQGTESLMLEWVQALRADPGVQALRADPRRTSSAIFSGGVHRPTIIP